MKKRLVRINAILLLLTLCFGLTACGAPSYQKEKLSVVVTAFPVYDWCRELLGNSDTVQITWLLEKGGDMHSFQPGTGDIVAIADCDLFIHIGGESDAWVQEVLEATAGRERKLLNLMEVLKESLLEEELAEGMEGEQEEEAAFDEHIWLSVKNARLCCQAIEAALEQLEPSGTEGYRSRLKTYEAELTALDREFERITEAAASQGKNTALVADRFPFLYLFRDYGIRYYAAFPGCSSESNASFETIVFLAEKLKQEALPAILELEHSDSSIASAVKEASGLTLPILKLDSLQSCSREETLSGRNYLSVMKNNLAVLEAALEGGETCRR